MKKTLLISLFFILISTLYAESEGVKLFKANYPKDAIPLLEQEIAEGNASAEIYNYLGLSYYQMEEYEKSVKVFEKGLQTPSSSTKILAFNQGNSYYALADYEKAANSYSVAIAQDPEFSSAILNRANALLMAGQLTNSLEDYELYLTKVPENEQKEQISSLIEALKEEIARREEERLRLLAEQAAMWELVDDDFSAYSGNDGNQWEKIETENLEDRFAGDKKNWEEFAADKPESSTDKNQLALDDENQKTEDWEHVENTAIKEVPENSLAEKADWKGLSDDEQKELKKVEEEVRAEQARLNELERKRLETEQAAAKAEAERKKLEEKLAKQKAEENAIKAEVERRKKLLEDVANSLQQDTSNMSSNAEETIDYSAEGELD